MELLDRKHAQLSYHDPFVPTLQRSRRYDFQLQLGAPDARDAWLPRMPCSSPRTIPRSITTSSSAHSRLVVDTRNATRNVREGRERIVLA